MTSSKSRPRYFASISWDHFRRSPTPHSIRSPPNYELATSACSMRDCSCSSRSWFLARPTTASRKSSGVTQVHVSGAVCTKLFSDVRSCILNFGPQCSNDPNRKGHLLFQELLECEHVYLLLLLSNWSAIRWKTLTSSRLSGTKQWGPSVQQRSRPGPHVYR